MRDYKVEFLDGSVEIVKAWDVSSAYEFAQDIFNKPIKSIIK